MKCWVIQKMLPLYVGGDLPFGTTLVEGHIEHCPQCTTEFDAYHAHREKLKSLHEVSLPSQATSGYWEELSAKIALQQGDNLAAPAYDESLFESGWSNLARLKAAALLAAIFCVGALIVADNNSKNIPSNTSPTVVKHQDNFVRPVHNFMSQQQQQSSQKQEKVLYDIIDLNMLFQQQRKEDTKEEYRLEQVHPCMLKNVSSF